MSPMNDQQREFQARLKKVESGSSKFFDKKKIETRGLYNPKPLAKQRRISYFRILMSVVVLWVFLLLLRLGVVNYMGEAAYTERMEALAKGDAFEWLGARIMYIGPIARGFESLLDGLGAG